LNTVHLLNTRTKENRLAQLATVDQQREVMGYLRGLNEWLELDVHNRQSEIKGIYTTVNQISRDIHEMQTRGRESISLVENNI